MGCCLGFADGNSLYFYLYDLHKMRDLLLYNATNLKKFSKKLLDFNGRFVIM